MLFRAQGFEVGSEGGGVHVSDTRGLGLGVSELRLWESRRFSS